MIPAIAAVVRQQLCTMRAAIADLVPPRRHQQADQIAEGFVAVCSSYSQQLAVRGDPDPAPFTAALMAIITS